ncbi:hypothetical protein GDO78_008807 [Eleutherodactylus coqui]|uniref:Uncharacterized protein n=1 Tax=Eleutherodactylus coqui TaxID=57060 RepID=A0A8J6KB87_ELECQ|nr:hypothetical protein GDO78_008807 [Eleutherodactylus coqui]
MSLVEVTILSEPVLMALIVLLACAFLINDVVYLLPLLPCAYTMCFLYKCFLLNFESRHNRRSLLNSDNFSRRELVCESFASCSILAICANLSSISF